MIRDANQAEGDDRNDQSRRQCEVIRTWKVGAFALRADEGAAQSRSRYCRYLPHLTHLQTSLALGAKMQLDQNVAV
jgi:hypothetical protein